MEANVTRASDIALPQRIVELKHLKTRAGEPARVQCEAVDELVVAEMFGPPGARPESVSQGGERDREAETRLLLACSPAMVHVATALAGDDGGEIRPAFHCDEAHAVSGSFPWRMVRFEDKLDVILAILELSGVGGAAGAAFHGSEREGSGDGVGIVAPGESDGNAAA